MQESATILEHGDKQLNIKPIKIINKTLNTVHSPININNLKLGKLTDILHNPTLLIINNKNRRLRIFNLLILAEDKIIDVLPDILIVQIYHSDYAA